MTTPPRTRADCVDGIRPCPFSSCRYHLGCESRPHRDGSARGPGDTLPSCALDVADEGPMTLDRIAAIMGVCHEAVRQSVAGALRRLRMPLKSCR